MEVCVKYNTFYAWLFALNIKIVTYMYCCAISAYILIWNFKNSTCFMPSWPIIIIFVQELQALWPQLSAYTSKFRSKCDHAAIANGISLESHS